VPGSGLNRADIDAMKSAYVRIDHDETVLSFIVP
jgi:hypothetical protein